MALCSVNAVPLYDSLGESAVEYTVNHSETSIIFAEASKLVFLAKAAKNVKENVKTVVYWGDAPTVKDASASIEKEVRHHVSCKQFLEQMQCRASCFACHHVCCISPHFITFIDACIMMGLLLWLSVGQVLAKESFN